MHPFKGYITALITPFANGKVDFASFEQFVTRQINEGIHGLVPCGTTGESPTLSADEMAELFRTTIRVRNALHSSIPVIAGTGSNNTHHAIELTKIAEQCGADAALIVTPYYNKPTQDGLYHHYKAIHDATNIPIILYNVPGRTAVELSIETVVRLAELPRIIGIKDATSDLSRATLLRAALGNKFALLSGEDGLAAGYLAQGGDGCISVTSNVAPSLCAKLYQAWIENNQTEFQSIQEKLAPLHKSLFIESSPAPAKYACAALGLCKDELRLPLLSATPNTRHVMDKVLADLNLTSATPINQKIYG